MLIACVDGLSGFPEAIGAVFPQAWVQTCIVHMIRSSMRYVSYAERKPLARDLRAVYSAPNAEEAARQLELFDETWGARYPMIAQAWRERWEHITPFLCLPADLRRIVYTTDENVKGLGWRVSWFIGGGIGRARFSEDLRSARVASFWGGAARIGSISGMRQLRRGYGGLGATVSGR